MSIYKKYQETLLKIALLQGGQRGAPVVYRGGGQAAAPRGLVQELAAVQRAGGEEGGHQHRAARHLQQPHHHRHPQVSTRARHESSQSLKLYNNGEGQKAPTIPSPD